MKYRFIMPITGLFTAVLLIANTLNVKIFSFYGIFLPAGIIVFPLSYLFGDILTEVYGYAVARRIIWTGFAGVLLMLLCYEIALRLPSAPFWEHDDAFSLIFSGTLRTVVASFTAYCCGEFVNSYVLAKLKVRAEGRRMSLRFVLSTIVGQFVDTGVFIFIAFVGVMSGGTLVAIMFNAWCFKVAWEIIALPITLPIVRKIKQVEQEDYFDLHTDFNPFHIK